MIFCLNFLQNCENPIMSNFWSIFNNIQFILVTYINQQKSNIEKEASKQSTNVDHNFINANLVSNYKSQHEENFVRLFSKKTTFKLTTPE